MKTAGIDIVRLVWAEDYEPLTVEPSADCPGYVRVYAKDGASKEFWGSVDFNMPKDFALQLAAAVTACAEEQA